MKVKSKYLSKKTIIDNIIFASKKEANRYLELKLLERAGKIENLELQPVFELQPTFKKNGKTYRAIKYMADFKYNEINKIVIEDTKGFKNKVYLLKRKLFEYKYPNLTIIER